MRTNASELGELVSGVVNQVVGQVREHVRAGRLDPVSNARDVHRLVEDLVSDAVADVTTIHFGDVHYDNEDAIRVFTSDTYPDPHDVDSMLSEIHSVLSGFGVLQPLLEDSSIEEIWINEPNRIFVARSGKHELTNLVLSDSELRILVERMLASSGRRVDLSSPFVDAALPDGSRLHVAIPDITRKHWSINVRKFVMAARTLDELVGVGTLTESAATFLRTCVQAGLNVIVAGATQAGKTTLMNALLNSVQTGERIVTCEEIFELQLDHQDWVALQTRQPSLEGSGEISLRRLIKESLRMRPTRLVVGEVRQDECLDLLVAMNSGMPSMCSIHANSAREAIAKLCLLPMLAGNNVSSEFVTPTVAQVVDVIVHTAMDDTGQRRIREIATVSGRVENMTIEVSDVFGWDGAELVYGGYLPPEMKKLAARGIDLVELNDMLCRQDEVGALWAT